MTATENRPVSDTAVPEEFRGSTEQATVSDSAESRTQVVSTVPPFVPTSQESIIERTVAAYLTTIVDDASVTLPAVRDDLLRRINGELALENRGRKESGSSLPAITLKQVLDEHTVAKVLLARHRIVSVDLAEGEADDMTALAVYVDFGDEEGTYSTSKTRLKGLLSELKPSMSAKAIDSAYARLQIHAPVATRTVEPHLIPVANGVFDHARQELREFSPNWIFLSKIPIDYDPNALNPVFRTPDGDDWDVESWIMTLSDDKGVPELLWEIISASVRSYWPWNKAIWFMSERGNNGKGTVIQLLRNLLGTRACSSIPFADFGKPFLMEPLLTSRVNLVDENDVGAFAERIAAWKAFVTGDAITLDRKYKTPVKMRWRGLDIQCQNSTTQRTKDRSESFYRRLLLVPFPKWFGSSERRYIKQDYLARPEVLRYVLRRALSMDHEVLSVPDVCRQALDDYRGDNNMLLTFWLEHEKSFVWDLLPFRFLHALYCAWFRRVNPSGHPESQTALTAFLRVHLAGSTTWQPMRGDVRPGTMMDAPEMLIAEFELTDWMNSTYTGSDPLKRCLVHPLKGNYKGIRRLPQTGTAPANGADVTED